MPRCSSMPCTSRFGDGQVGPRPIYAAIGVDLAGHCDALGMWASEGDGEPVGTAFPDTVVQTCVIQVSGYEWTTTPRSSSPLARPGRLTGDTLCA